MTEEVKVEEKTQSRKATSRFLLLEIYDNNGNLIEGLDANNIKVVTDCKKPDEEFILSVQSHPKGIIFKI